MSEVDRAASRALELLGPAPASWVPVAEGVDRDVVIVGAGQSGIAIAFALLRAGITNIEVIDAETGTPGVWSNRAYMERLRTPKANRGPDLGIPALTFRAWYEARSGATAYDAFDTAPREAWDDYLAWLRRSLGISVRGGTRLRLITRANRRFELELEENGAPVRLAARKLVLATGIAGSGGPAIPDVLRGLPPGLVAHSYDRFSFDDFRGKRIGILGAASSAFDIAASALEHGAAEAHLFSRGAELAHFTQLRATAYGGIDGFHVLPDADRWEIARLIRQRGPAPSKDTLARALRLPGLHLHLAAPWRKARAAGGGRVEVEIDAGPFVFDAVVAGTGFTYDPTLAPELAALAPQIALWGDRYTPPAAKRDPVLARFPYLGPGYEFTEKHPGTAPFVRDVHCFTPAAIASFGRFVSDVASLATGVPRLVSAIIESFVRADRAHHLARMTQQPADDIAFSDYAAAVRPAAATLAALPE
ncbi:NAD(P)/FAD-dependent oxidoreductase [Xanthobacter autotrophicus DSM 431]|uniref:NAD(P)-binding domain-containing protein n=1 Tax=Xanthobacter nonsaccharivorans TaxID=3119912 RepID=UPI00372C21B8